ncbi:MAG TPA: DUF2600 family protein [Solirubrobacterales bacterium]
MEIFPIVRQERARWRDRALEIPDPVLREDALLSIEEKWGHSEGAAAFALLVPKQRRKAFVRMAVAYQLMIDFLDTISERLVSDPWANTVQLHLAAEHAVARVPLRAPDYYMFHSHRGDGGFLASQVATCREILVALPSSPSIGNRIEGLTSLYVESQGHCHAEQAGVGSDPTQGIDEIAKRFPELNWGEVLAACNTSVPVFALMAQAAHEEGSESEIDQCHAAYFPWVASLHILLHSLVDEAFDLASGKFNQLGHYASKEEAANSLDMIATTAVERLSQLPRADTHVAVLGGMAGYYLSSPAAWEEENRPIAESVLEAIGPGARWSMLSHRLRQRL